MDAGPIKFDLTAIFGRPLGYAALMSPWWERNV